MRHALLALALMVPFAAPAQPTTTFADGRLTVIGTAGDDFLSVGCAAGTAQLDGADLAGVACDAVTRIDFAMGAGVNGVALSGLGDFSLDPADPGEYRGGDELDVLDLDLSDHTQDLALEIRRPSDTGRTAGSRAAHRAAPLVRDRTGAEPTDLYAFAIHDEIRFGIVWASGPGDDVVQIDPTFPARPLEGLSVFGGGGSDALDFGALPSSITAGLDVVFNGQEGDDRFVPPPTGGAIGWAPGGGTDRFTPGPGPDGVLIFGSAVAPLTAHEIRGVLGEGCAYVDFSGGGGVVVDGPERVERVRYVMSPALGGDVFSEFECGGVERDLSRGNSGDDQFHARGPAGGDTRIVVDFEAGQMEIFADGFESGDVSAWTDSSPRHATRSLRAGDDVLWDGVEYQDWPSFADPSTSGPSTAIVRGEPAFPVTLAMGPDGGAGRGGGVDTLRIDPLGLPVTDDGSQIVIGTGAPITYSGVETVDVVSSTAAEADPSALDPVLTAAPTPATRSVRVRLRVGAPVDARLTLVDALGRAVLVLHDGPVAAGARAWALDAGRLAPGLYLVHARGDGWAASQPVVVVE